ncbi:tRNA (adenosine(37)-N6)-threonylcarbamoyltransferase complex ATPase subunit type 1 TsaE [Rhodobacter sp. KR11]|uniref:tRNA (adenosine(37)-N6)-threonylcarbamoyltransferase complex ATPase subunit type 1 TsaE n=1 Tax=Rhodobacter sp. KR11 TaxID=2974588 RepID=UPI002222859B|nr:tRNA (adenosine(37)-N6)-threonylcarbamoyltransferase complex ATPase subunit type 1 TsaE [Rhodobacter sp. KR11]
MDQTFDLVDESDTSALGRALGQVLGAGSVLLLSGPIGSGKSHLARALIRSRLGEATEVPSPTFTLVQTYPGDPEIWHADLYRLTHPDEVLELGLEDAFSQAICLVEWPDRLGKAVPLGAHHLTFTAQGEGRRLTVSPPVPGLMQAFRAEQTLDFLSAQGLSDVPLTPLPGDASARRYARVKGMLLMDAPKDQPDRTEDFSRIANHLRDLGLSAPKVSAEDHPRGFLLVEDLGDPLYPKVIAQSPDLQPMLYEAATDVLRHLQSHPAPDGLPNLTAAQWAEAAGLALDHYAPASPQTRADLIGLLTEALARADGPRVLILRDFHAENLLWLKRPGLARVGLLDFQLAQMGQPGYDLVSLTQDARRDVPPELEAHLVARFDPSPDFATAHAVLGAQRALRILGIFARLATQGKPRYLDLIPRVRGYLDRNLAHPALADLKSFCDKTL